MSRRIGRVTDGRGLREAAAGHPAVPAARTTAPPARTAARGVHPAAPTARTRVDA
ncbi:hypothetical protein ACFVTF_18105 [Kitasatospora sp. NPDC057940]|uniref:hypothetical protein n=1 Tax=Kitasatospora sp. NPDC057940 TaxID=3346285 RepID=UPI0036DB8FA5